MDWDRVPGVLFSIPFVLNSQTPLIFIHRFLVHATSCRPAGPGNRMEFPVRIRTMLGYPQEM